MTRHRWFILRGMALLFFSAAFETTFGAVTSGDTTNPTYFLGKVGIATNAPTVSLDVNGGVRAGSSTAVTTCSASTEGTQRYNYGSHAMEFCNWTTWTQVTSQVTGATAPVTASGPPVSANVYTFAAVTANYSPIYGSIANTYDQSWPANGTGDYRNSNCGFFNDNSSYILYDLGSVKTINNAYVAVGGAYGSIGMSFSTDGTTFTGSALLNYAGGGGIRYTAVALSPAPSARYVRLANGSNNNNDYADLCEFAVGP